MSDRKPELCLLKGAIMSAGNKIHSSSGESNTEIGQTNDGSLQS